MTRRGQSSLDQALQERALRAASGWKPTPGRRQRRLAFIMFTAEIIAAAGVFYVLRYL